MDVAMQEGDKVVATVDDPVVGVDLEIAFVEQVDRPRSLLQIQQREKVGVVIALGRGEQDPIQPPWPLDRRSWSWSLNPAFCWRPFLAQRVICGGSEKVVASKILTSSNRWAMLCSVGVSKVCRIKAREYGSKKSLRACRSYFEAAVISSHRFASPGSG